MSTCPIWFYYFFFNFLFSPIFPFSSSLNTPAQSTVSSHACTMHSRSRPPFDNGVNERLAKNFHQARIKQLSDAAAVCRETCSASRLREERRWCAAAPAGCLNLAFRFFATIQAFDRHGCAGASKRRVVPGERRLPSWNRDRFHGEEARRPVLLFLALDG